MAFFSIFLYKLPKIDFIGVKMKKKLLLLIILSFSIILTSNFNVVFGDNVRYYLGGYPVGIELTTRGALVVGTCDVVTEKGIDSPSKKVGITAGDRIMYIDSIEINDAFDIETAIKAGGEKTVIIKRNEEIINYNIIPVKDMTGCYKIGVFVKNGINGIGTLTYFTDKGDFASLGHPVFLNDKIAEVKKGNLYFCSITSFISGEYSKPGELKGVFIKDKIIGKVYKNQSNGVFGQLDEYDCYKNLREVQLGEGTVGDAVIYTTINGTTPKEYSVSIVKVDTKEGSLKNYVIKVTDKELISQTGGIVQGMSGSPILQNGKLIGAITHVFTNDPTRGFGISINNMINN